MPSLPRLVALSLLVATTLAPAPLRAQGTLVVANRADATVSLVGVRDRDVYATIPTGFGPNELAVSPDGRLALVSNYGGPTAPGNTLTLVDLAARGARATISLGGHRRPHGIVWLPDGKRALVTSEMDSSLLLVDVERQAVVGSARTGEGISHMVVRSPDGRRAYVTNLGSGSLTAIDVPAMRVVKTVPLPAEPEGLDVTPDGRELWVTSRGADRVTVLDAATLDTLASLASPRFPVRVRITPDGHDALVTNARSSELRIFDVRGRREVATMRLRVDRAALIGSARAEGWLDQTAPVGIAVSADGRTAFVANAGADIVSVVDLRKRKVSGYILVGREPYAMALSPLAEENR
ncbi:MAG TPA: cytochrome D1 domain-containing protein [Gemmatimonadaceae bacterium]|nr:cytochrome D1 domain-containing protein [Gemmatimonadaceae bacterium]